MPGARASLLPAGAVLVMISVPTVHLGLPALQENRGAWLGVAVLLLAMLIAGWVCIAIGLAAEPYEGAWDDPMLDTQRWLGPLGSALIVLGVLAAFVLPVSSRTWARVLSAVLFSVGWLCVITAEILAAPGWGERGTQDRAGVVLCTLAGALTVILGATLLSMLDDRAKLEPGFGRDLSSGFVPFGRGQTSVVATLVFVLGWLAFISQGIRWIEPA